MYVYFWFFWINLKKIYRNSYNNILQRKVHSRYVQQKSTPTLYFSWVRPEKKIWICVFTKIVKLKLYKYISFFLFLKNFVKTHVQNFLFLIRVLSIYIGIFLYITVGFLQKKKRSNIPMRMRAQFRKTNHMEAAQEHIWWSDPFRLSVSHKRHWQIPS